MEQIFNFKQIFNDVYGEMGFSTNTLSNSDLNMFRNIIKTYYINQLEKYDINFTDWKDLEMNEYHKFYNYARI